MGALLAEADSWAGAVGLTASALVAGIVTIYVARRTGVKKESQGLVEVDDELVGLLWRETLSRLDEIGEDRDRWKKRCEAAERREIALLRKLALGDGV